MPSRAAAALAAASLLAGAAAQRTNPYAPWRLREVARAECRGGGFYHVSIAADATRMLTIGELGDAIEWDLGQARERKRFAPIGDDVADCCMHPNDPWAVVIAGDRRTPRAHRLDFGTGRYTELWTEPVAAVAFDATGALAAVLFTDPNRGSRLAVFPEAALRTPHPPAPDFVHALPRAWPDRLFFHPRGDAVYVGGISRETWRIPLDGSETTRATDDLHGFLSDGTEVVETREHFAPSAAGMHQVWGWSDIGRGGPLPATWTLPEAYGPPRIASDGTVVAADECGTLQLLGPAEDRRRTLRGHRGPVLQLCFDAADRHVAIVGGSMLTILDADTGSCVRLDGTFAVQALPAPGELALLEPRAVVTIRATDGWRRTSPVSLPADVEATTFERYWTGRSALRPFRWLPEKSEAWLADAVTPNHDAGPVLVAGRNATPLACELPADASSYQVGLALGAGRDGDVVLATTTRPAQCGVGSDKVRWWSTLRTYDRSGKQRCARPLPDRIRWMRTSPAGSLVAVPADEGKVRVYAAHDLHPIHEIDLHGDDVVAFEFVDERQALVSDGARLLHVMLASGIAKPIAVALPGPITTMCVSPDRTRVAVACDGEVRVLQRR